MCASNSTAINHPDEHRRHSRTRGFNARRRGKTIGLVSWWAERHSSMVSMAQEEVQEEVKEEVKERTAAWTRATPHVTPRRPRCGAVAWRTGHRSSQPAPSAISVALLVFLLSSTPAAELWVLASAGGYVRGIADLASPRWLKPDPSGGHFFSGGPEGGPSPNPKRTGVAQVERKVQ